MKQLLCAWLLICLPLTVRSAEPNLTGRKGETIFFLLGMLDDYLGRNFVEDDNQVERFYCNEHVQAFVFRAYLSRVAEEQNLSPTIGAEWKQDCLVAFRSDDMSALINSFYIYKLSDDVRALTPDGPKRTAFASL